MMNVRCSHARGGACHLRPDNNLRSASCESRIATPAEGPGFSDVDNHQKDAPAGDQTEGGSASLVRPTASSAPQSRGTSRAERPTRRAASNTTNEPLSRQRVPQRTANETRGPSPAPSATSRARVEARGTRTAARAARTEAPGLELATSGPRPQASSSPHQARSPRPRARLPEPQAHNARPAAPGPELAERHTSV